MRPGGMQSGYESVELGQYYHRLLLLVPMLWKPMLSTDMRENWTQPQLQCVHDREVRSPWSLHLEGWYSANSEPCLYYYLNRNESALTPLRFTQATPFLVQFE